MKHSTVLLLSLAFLASCAPKDGTQNRNSSNTGSLVAGKYFSMRPQASTLYVGIIQLTTPALLSTAKLVNGKPVIDENQKKELIHEQEEIIKRLKAISPEVKILSTYKLVLNGIAFIAPSDAELKITALEGVNRVLESVEFDRPQTVGTEEKIKQALDSLNTRNSVTFIGAEKVHQEGISGEKMRVGVIDSGVDYTHSMFGGAGTKEVYDSIDPSLPTKYFPTAKVVGGVDFVGSKFRPSSEILEERIPVRDENPIDESGHGTHVAGSIAGIGNGETSYSGVAPEAELYALKVFGKGGTNDIIVIQALEYAADPSENINPENRLDVINLSLGGNFGKPQVLYSEAVKNLTKAGTVVVASAGNSGDTPYITGAPATADEAISVGASIDNMAHNIDVPASILNIGASSSLVERTEGSKTLSALESNVSGAIVYLGVDGSEATTEVKAQVKGRIALLDRGITTFEEKFDFAKKLGAIGVIVANNQEADPIVMGSEKSFDFPAVMIKKSVGQEIKKALAAGAEANFSFSSTSIIQKTELIDTMTSFSSRGPRSMDSLIKPEISGPGYNIISASYGTGNVMVKMSGTSMSGPHLAGVLALMKQAFPEDSTEVLKARVLNNAKILVNADNSHVGVARQGAGRVQVYEAYKNQAYALPATLSLGAVPVASLKRVAKSVTVTNTSDEDIIFSTSAIHSKNIKVDLQGSFRVRAKSTATIPVSFTLGREDASQNNVEADGFVILTNNTNGSKISIPFLAVLNKVSDIAGETLVTHTDSKIDRYGAEVTLTLKNESKSSGDALIFNLLGTDKKDRVANKKNNSVSTLCDLEAAGLRIVNKEDEDGTVRVLQLGIKLYGSMTSWQPCDVSLQIDSNGDGIADQELVGIKANYISGITTSIFASIFLDAEIARTIRSVYEADRTVAENYLPAVLGAREMKFYDHSNVAVVEVALDQIARDANGKVGIKVATMHLEGRANYDDFLGDHETTWQQINLSKDAFAFYDMPEKITVGSNGVTRVSMRRGMSEGELLVLYPHNTPASLEDKQSQILKEQLLK